MKTRTGKYCFGYAVGLNRWSMRLLGLWPLDKRFSTLKWSVAFVVALVFLFPSMGRMVTLIDWRSILEQAVLTVPLALLLLKLSYIRLGAKNFKIILETMIDDWAKFAHLPRWSQDIMIEYARTGRRVNIICISCMVLSIIGYMGLPTGSKSQEDQPANMTVRKLPTEGLYPFDAKASPAYEIIYVSQSIVSCLYCMTTFSIDCFLSVIVFHACGQFSVLAKILAQYGERTRHVGKEVSSICACLHCIVQRHVLIIDTLVKINKDNMTWYLRASLLNVVVRYMDIVELSFNVFVLLQLCGNCFILAIEGYGLVAHAEDNNTLGFLTFVVYTSTVTYNMFIYCYIGDCIIQKSEEIADTAYNLEWDNLPQDLAEPLILIMVRSRRHCKITAGRFAVMTLSYYKTILTTSVSYISVLRALN